MATAKKPLFSKQLTESHGKIKARRAEMIQADAEDASNALINKLKSELRQIRLKKMNVEDISPQSTITLNVVEGTFDGEEWIKKLNDLTNKETLKEIELNTAKAIHTKWFEAK